MIYEVIEIGNLKEWLTIEVRRQERFAESIGESRNDIQHIIERHERSEQFVPRILPRIELTDKHRVISIVVIYLTQRIYSSQNDNRNNGFDLFQYNHRRNHNQNTVLHNAWEEPEQKTVSLALQI